ncbi:MAG TPA: hypothetical protein PLW86_15125, partial [Rhodocyclaceae bacterium]|nr:hypothetical protein [Rhodocyclaceae bacterium]
RVRLHPHGHLTHSCCRQTLQLRAHVNILHQRPNYLLFNNIQSNQYWSRTTFTQNPQTPNDNAWVFYFPGGVQQTIAVENFEAVWAVRDGDVVPLTVSEPASLALALIGILGLGVSRLKNKPS